MKKVVILGDSLSLPRDELSIEYTYPFLINNSLKDKYVIFNRSIRANDTNLQIKNFFQDVVVFNPDIVILHLGIVDCAPRLFSRSERKFYSRVNKIFPIVNLMNKYRYVFTKKFPKTYVNIKEFETNYYKLLSRINKKIILVGISDTTEINKSKSFNYEKNIILYNNILKKNIEKFDNIHFIDMFKYNPEEILLKDGIHFNEKGSKILADNIIEILVNND